MGRSIGLAAIPAEDRVHRRADPQDDGDGVSLAHPESAIGSLGREGGLSAERPVLIDRFLEDAIEVDVDALRDATGEVVIGAVMEHVEEAGVHSGDSACVIPPPTLPHEVVEVITQMIAYAGFPAATNALMTALTLSRRGLRQLTVLGGAVRTTTLASGETRYRRRICGARECTPRAIRGSTQSICSAVVPSTLSCHRRREYEEPSAQPIDAICSATTPARNRCVRRLSC
mgnify:CR=1 FL=1